MSVNQRVRGCRDWSFRAAISNRNPLHDVSRHRSCPPVVQPRRSRAGVTREVLHVVERYALLKQICDYCSTKRVACKPRDRKARCGEAAFDHAKDVVGGHPRVGKSFGLADVRPWACRIRPSPSDPRPARPQGPWDPKRRTLGGPHDAGTPLLCSSPTVFSPPAGSVLSRRVPLFFL